MGEAMISGEHGFEYILKICILHPNDQELFPNFSCVGFIVQFWDGLFSKHFLKN